MTKGYIKILLINSVFAFAKQSIFPWKYNHRFHIRFTLMVAILWGQCTYQKKMRKERKLSSLQNISSKYCNKSTGFIRGLFRHGLHFLWVILFIYCFFLLQLSIIVIFTKSLIKLCSQITKFYYKRNLIFSFFLFLSFNIYHPETFCK